MGDKLQGHYARLALVDADGNEMEKHFVRLCVCLCVCLSLCPSTDPALTTTPHTPIQSTPNQHAGASLAPIQPPPTHTPHSISPIPNPTKQARDFTPLSNLMKRPDDEAWVAAKWGDKFGIKVFSRVECV